MQLLKELAPRVKRVAAVARRLPPGRPRGAWRIATQAGADALGVELVWVGVDTADDLEPAFATIVRERCDALYVVLTEVNIRHRRHIIDLAARHRLPAVYWERQFVDAGGLISYGESDAWVYRRAAAYVDKILKGARPADLPVEQPTAFELVINLKAAKALGLAVPQALRLRADEVIE
jgi:putative ABC transport system substrate-binding protein